MATALIQITQGANTDVAGKAVLGVHDDFSTVTVTNGDNTGVVGWKIYMLDAPPDSGAFPVGTLPMVLAEAADGMPTADFDPDVAGTYRLMLETVDGSLQVDRDIRCFAIPDARGFVRPPYQDNPAPLPIPRPAIIADWPLPVKPDEQNYGDNVRGWSGNGSAAQLDEFFRRYDDLPPQVVNSTPFEAVAAGAPVYLVDLPTIGGAAAFSLPDTPRVGYVTRIVALGPDNPAAPLTIAPVGGSIGQDASLQIRGGSSVVLLHRGVNAWSILSRADVLSTETAPVTVISYSSSGVLTETFDTLTAAVAKNFPSSFPNSALYVIAPNLNDPAAGPFALDNTVEYSFRSLAGWASGLANLSVVLPAMTIQGNVRVEGCLLSGAVTGFGQLVVHDSIVTNVDVSALVGRNSQFSDDTTLTLGNCRLDECQVGAAVTLVNTATEDAVVELYDCTFGATPTVEFDPGPGVLRLDASSYYWWQAAGGTLVNGTLSLVGPPQYFQESEPSLTTIVGDMPAEDAYWRVEGATPPVLGFDVGPSTFVGIHGWVSETQLNLYANGTQRVFASFPDADSAYWAFQLNEENASFGASVGPGGGPNTYFLATPDALTWQMTAEAGSPANVIEARNDDPGGPTLAFFGSAPVLRPSVTGSDPQDQIDSVVAALVALGLATDDRV